MKRHSSTSDSETFNFRPLLMIAMIAAAFMGANVLATLVFLKFKGKTPTGEWAQKQVAFKEFTGQNRRLDLLFIGDSTVSGGLRPGFITQNGFNFGRNGGDPSEILDISKSVTNGRQLPKTIFLSVTPGFTSQNLWKNPFQVPFLTNLEDGARLFFEDTNSFKSSFQFGGYLTMLTMQSLYSRLEKRILPSRALGGPETPERFVDADGAYLSKGGQESAEIAKFKLRYRRANFEMMNRFKRSWNDRGVRVVWIYMPYRQDYQRLLTGEEAAFYGSYCAGISAIFGQDVVDLRNTVPYGLFFDQVHLNSEGARMATLALGKQLGL